MKKWLKKHLKNEKGLTLVELLAVIVILGIIAAIAVPAIGNIIQNSREKAVIADAQNVLAAGNLYFTANPDKDTVSLEGDGDGDFLIPEFLDDSILESAKVSKNDEGASVIEFKGKAGKKEIDVSGKTKADLNSEEIFDEFK